MCISIIYALEFSFMLIDMFSRGIKQMMYDEPCGLSNGKQRSRSYM